MMTCKQIHKALADGDYKDLSPWQLFLLRFHIGMCFLCRRFNRDIMLFQDTARAFRQHEEYMGADASLPPEARERMRTAIQAACESPR